MKRLLGLILLLLMSALLLGQVNYEPAVRKNIVTQDSNGVKYADTFAGADIGAKINAAYAACLSKGCTIRIKPQNACYGFSTPIVLNTANKPALLQGEVSSGMTNDGSQGGVCLNYTPTTSTDAITLDWDRDAGNGYFGVGGGMRDITLINAGSCETVGGCGSSATGVQIGVTNGGIGFGRFTNVKIQGFGTGVHFPANADETMWGTSFENVTFKHNTLGVLVEEANETIQFFGGIFVNGGQAIKITQPAYIKFFGTHFDSNNADNVIEETSSSGGQVELFAPHFENLGLSSVAGNGNTFIHMNSDLQIFGGEIVDQTTSGTRDYYFRSASAITIKGLALSSAGGAVSNLVSANTADIAVSNATPAVFTNVCSQPQQWICHEMTPSTNTALITTPKLRLNGGSGNRMTLEAENGSSGTTTFPNVAGTVLTSNDSVKVQRIISTTTCTTAATVGANCQTAAISFAVPFPSANYSLTCSLRGVTAPGAIMQVENTSASTFKISIVTITAAAMSYSAVNCIALHP